MAAELSVAEEHAKLDCMAQKLSDLRLRRLTAVEDGDPLLALEHEIEETRLELSGRVLSLIVRDGGLGADDWRTIQDVLREP